MLSNVCYWNGCRYGACVVPWSVHANGSWACWSQGSRHRLVIKGCRHPSALEVQSIGPEEQIHHRP
jgi:hypothetical protein